MDVVHVGREVAVGGLEEDLTVRVPRPRPAGRSYAYTDLTVCSMPSSVDTDGF